MSDYAQNPIDPDVDLHVPADRSELRPHAAPVLAAICAGGMLGSTARFAIGAAWPHQPSGFPWATLLINVSGCLLIGALMVIVTEVATGRRLLRPFLGVGVLGGYTTFSTYVTEAERVATAGRPGLGLTYLAVTLGGAMLAVWAGADVTAWLVRRARSA